MSLNLSPTQLAFNARGDGSFNKPFQAQVAFFRSKLNLPTQHYDAIVKSAHDRAFIVAGAMKADLLDDLRKAVDQAIEQGQSIGWFRQQFDSIVQKHGWEGWTGSDSAAGRAWRTRVIYQTNVSTSYAAGRWAQLHEPDLLSVRPYWKYVHSDAVSHPRPLHVSWHGLVLRYDDPWWQTHFPPNGWGCRCRIVPVKASEFKGDKAPIDGTYTKVDRFGQRNEIPKGIDYGFDYAPGQSNVELVRRVIEKQDGATWQLARANTQYLVSSDIFTRFFNGDMAGEFPIAVLNNTEMSLIGAESKTILLSRQSIDEHIAKHPEITVDDYRKAQEIIDKGELYTLGDNRLIFLLLDGVWYRAALKRTSDRQKNYFLTLFKNERGKPPGGAIKIER